MSEYVYSRHGGELLLAERAADERAVSAALKDFDRTLRLVWEVDQKTGLQVWNVVAVWSPEHPAVQVLTWRDETTLAPYPLTMRLVDEVKRLRQVDTMRMSDQANASLRAQVDKELFDSTLDITTEFERLDRVGRVHVPHRVGSQKLAQAKRRGRSQGRAV